MDKCNNKELIIFSDVPPKFDGDRIAKYAEAGFTYYNLTEDWVTRDDENGGITKEYYDAIELCHEHGLKVILRTMRGNSPDYYDGITDEFAGKVEGFYMNDEPVYQPCWLKGVAEISKLPKLVEWYNQYGGDTFWHINLLQDYGITQILHSDLGITYEQYVDKYITEVLKHVKGKKSLTTDHYPLSYDESGVKHIKETVLRDYYLLAERAKELKAEGHDVQSGFCIQLTCDAGLRLRTPECPADITFQTNLSAAFGSNVYEYYLYAGNEGGILNNKEEQTQYTPLYDYVKRANAELAVLGEEILDYEWNASKVFVGSETSCEHNRNGFALVEKYQPKSFAILSEFHSSADALVSELICEDDFAYMAVNFTEPTDGICNECRFVFDSSVRKVLIVKGGIKEEVLLEQGILNISLEAGEGVFVKIIR